MEAKKLMLLPLLLAAACGPAGNPPNGVVGERAAGAVATEVRLAKLPDSRVGDAAAAVGTLRPEGACLYLAAGGSTRYLIAFTIPGARWDAAREALIVPPGESEAGEYRSGERVTLGGSEARAAALSGQWVEPPAAACDTRRIWVANSIGAAGPG